MSSSLAMDTDHPLEISDFLRTWQGRPQASDFVVALKALEKQKPATPSAYADLLGIWQLYFITGTQQVRKTSGGGLNSGRFLPQWVKIQLRYTDNVELFKESLTSESAKGLSGAVENSVQLGAVKLILTGPVQFYPKRQILAFDFTRIQIKLFQRSLYRGFIRGGKGREANFLGQTLKEQAFFKYFLIQSDCIAARGRGGGLAVWVKEF